MKRLLQIIAMGAVALIALQPGMAAFVCSTASQCAMSMSEMVRGCPIAGAAASACSPDCCDHRLAPTAQGYVLVNESRERNALFASVAFLFGFAISPTQPVAGVLRPEPIPPDSPPSYLPHRVFRI